MDGALGPAFPAYAIASTLVCFHLLVLGFATGAVRLEARGYVNPEDANAFHGTTTEVDDPRVLRVQRAHRNAMESAVPFFVVGALYVATGATATGAAAYFYTFFAMRVLHAIFYLAGMQPWRTLAYTVGVFSILGMGLHVLRAAF